MYLPVLVGWTGCCTGASVSGRARPDRDDNFSSPSPSIFVSTPAPSPTSITNRFHGRGNVVRRRVVAGTTQSATPGSNPDVHNWHSHAARAQHGGVSLGRTAELQEVCRHTLTTPATAMRSERKKTEENPYQYCAISLTPPVIYKDNEHHARARYAPFF